MNKINAYTTYTHNTFVGREEIEWCNFWYSKANTHVEKRILLVGDSTARMVRSTLEQLSAIPVDMLGTSCGLHDIMFSKQVDAFFYSDKIFYDTIFVQLGQHSNYNELGKPYTEEDFMSYKQDLTSLITYLKQYTNKIVMLTIFYAVTPPCFNWLKYRLFNPFRRFKKENFDWEIDKITKRKNEIIAEIANSVEVEFLDINDYMIRRCEKRKTRVVHVDHIHFEDKGKAIIAKQYIKYID